MANKKRRVKTSVSLTKKVAFAACAAIIFAEILCITWCRVRYREVGLVIYDETQRLQMLMDQRNNFKIEYARLTSPERIERLAKQQLNLVMPSPEQIRTLP